MNYVLSPDEMRKLDSDAMNVFGIESAILMENAAHSAKVKIVDIIEKNKLINPSILIFCGVGNNGGDGFALARHLIDYGQCYIFCVGDITKMSEETKSNYNYSSSFGVPIIQINHSDDIKKINYKADIIIEALIGIGGSENLKGDIPMLLDYMNSSNAMKIAIDIPAGLNSLTGKVHKSVFKADYTITMYAEKIGMLLEKGPDVSGKVFLAELGVPRRIVKDYTSTKVLEKQDIKSLLKSRQRQSTKFNYGRVLVIAGSDNMPGAAALTANATIKSGAGLVELITTKLHPALLPEIMPHLVTTNEFGEIATSEIDSILDIAEKANCIVIGPGMGNSAKEICNSILMRFRDIKKIVIDADGLRAINKDSILNSNIILTPHFVEFSRISSVSIEDLFLDKRRHISEFVKNTHSTLVFKDNPTIIKTENEEYINVFGNPGMATAGAGDVLSGIIGAMICQNEDPVKATALAVLVHSLAGDKAAFSSQSALTASSIIEHLGDVLP